MVDQSLLLRYITEQAGLAAQSHDTGDILDRLTRQVVRLLGLHGAGGSLTDGDGSLEVVAASDQRIAELERYQQDGAGGPGRDASRSLSRVTSADLIADERWPAFKTAALTHGYRAVAAVALPAGPDLVGALSLYSRTPRDWSPDDLEVAEVLAALAGGGVATVRRVAAHEQQTAELRHALTSRVTIEQAKGVLAERHGIDPGAAFERLRRYARDHNQRVFDVARAVLDRRLEL